MSTKCVCFLVQQVALFVTLSEVVVSLTFPALPTAVHFPLLSEGTLPALKHSKFKPEEGLRRAKG